MRFLNPALLLLLASSFFTWPTLAKITEGDLTGTLNFEIFAGTGDASVEYSFEERNVDDENYFQQTLHLKDTSDRGEVETETVIDIGYSGQFRRDTGNLTGLDFVTITGNIYTDVEFTGSGTYLGTPGLSAIWSSLAPGNQLLQTFTVTEDGPELASITVAFNSLRENGSLATLNIEKYNPDNGTWTSAATFSSTGFYDYYNENRSLDPGLYRINGYNPTSRALGAEEAGFVIDQDIFYEITFGSPPLTVPLPEEGDFSYPNVGTEFTNPSSLQILNPSIVSEVALENDMTELTFATNLVNTSPCPWFLTRIQLSEAANEASGIIATNDGVIFPDIDAFSTTASIHNAVIQVPNAILDTVKASILDTSGLTVQGMELIVFRYPVTFAWDELTEYKTDQGTELHFWADSYNQEGFDQDEPPVERGEILVEWEALHSVPMILWTDVNGIERLQQNYDQHLPLLVTKTILDPGTIPDPRYRWMISGDKMSLLDIVKHGTIRHPVKNPFPGYTKNATEDNKIEEQSNFPQNILTTLNRFDIEDYIKVSGDFNFIPGEFALEYSLADGNLIDFLVRKSYTAEVNLLVETANHEEVGGEPIVDATKNILTTPIFTTALPGGITFSTALDIDIGATANLTRSLAVPFTSRYTYEVVTGIKDGNPYYENNTDYVPLHVSDPHIFEEIGAELELWADAELLCGLVLPDGTSSWVTGGARIDGKFGVHPLADPWWDLSSELKLTSGFEINLGVLFKLADEELDLATYTLFEKESDGPLLAGPSTSSITLPPEGVNPGLRPISDPTARWSRVLQMDTYNTETRNVFLIPLKGSNDFLTGQSNIANNRLYRIADDGRILKSLSTPQIRFKTIDAISLPDGGAMLLGGGNHVYLIRLDADLQTVSQHSFDFGSLTYSNLRIIASDTHVFVLGTNYFGTNNKQTVISSFDFEGNLAWTRSYTLDLSQTLTPADLIVCADGDLAFCATTSADLSAEEGFDQDLQIPNITNNGLLAKIDSETGDVRWASLIPHYSSPTYHALAESPAGEFTIGGYQLHTYPKNLPSMILLQLSDTGKLLETLQIGHSGSAKAADNPYASHLFSGLPHDGETYYDKIRDLAWTDEGLWACGEMGIYHPTSILSTGSSGFTIFFDPQLNPSRFALHGGLSQDSLDRIVVTDTGPLAVGGSASFLSWPIGATDETDSTPWAQWLLKLPWEGRLDFHEMSSAAQPHPDDPAPLAGSHFIYPRVVSGLMSGFYEATQFAEADIDDFTTNAARTLTATDLTLTPETLNTTLSETDVLDIKALEFTPESLVTDEASYLVWSQQEADQDADGDGHDASTEFYFGLDATTPDRNDLKLLSIDPVTIQVSRNKAAEGLPKIFDSENLVDWSSVAPTQITVDEQADSDVLEIELPGELEADSTFWKAEAP